MLFLILPSISRFYSADQHSQGSRILVRIFEQLKTLTIKQIRFSLQRRSTIIDTIVSQSHVLKHFEIDREFPLQRVNKMRSKHQPLL